MLGPKPRRHGRNPPNLTTETGPGTALTLNRSTFGAKRLRRQAKGGICRQPLPRGKGFGDGVTVNRRSPPIPERESPAEAGLNRVYVIVNNYRTYFDDFREVYLRGIQIDIE